MKKEEEFNFKKELQKIYENELSGKLTNAGRIYRKLRARDDEFIKRLKEFDPTYTDLMETIDKLVGEKLK